ncbi:uncharacterized protein LOC115403212 [Salarias fasciatus]|uniref:uncharacterized protein LOC115403212 n=1 Tax=Salarias fasciatus TaxID=181472 RepID=UPI0011769E3D|nr:uncharacterized protein LOC115403212 [Salarias fasciatus]
MNMLSLQERLNVLIILCCSAFVSINGGGEDGVSSCQAELLVRRGTIRRALPGHTVTVRCSLKHCGQPLNVTWCKIRSSGRCERIRETENVGITQQPDGWTKDEVTSSLSFKKISVEEDGLYRCEVKGLAIGHAINILVSDLNQEAQHSDDHAAESLKTHNDGSIVWLPYFAIFCGIALPVILLTGVTLLSFRSCYRPAMQSYFKRQEPFIHVSPHLAGRSAPSRPIPPPRLAVLSVAEAPGPPPPPLMSARTPPAAAAAASAATAGQVSDSPVYAVINHRKPGNQTRAPHATAAARPDGKQEYAEISFL